MDVSSAAQGLALADVGSVALDMSTVSVARLAMLAAALVCAGLLTGFLSGLLGIGGGGLLVPVLYETFGAIGVDPGIRMHMSLATSLAVIAVTSWSSFRAHRARGVVDLGVLRRLGAWVFAGVLVGILVASRSSSDGLKWMWIVFGSIMALKMALGRDDWRLGPELPKSIAVELFAVAVGFVSVLMSIGGGAYMVTLMTLYGRSLLQAVATSSGFGPLIAIPGMIGFAWAGWGTDGLPPLSLGYVSVIGAAAIIPSGIIAAPWGVRLAHGIPKRRLELAFALFLTLVVARFAVSLLA